MGLLLGGREQTVVCFLSFLAWVPPQKCERISNKKEQKERVSRPGLAPESPSEKKDKTQIRQLLHNATNC